MIQDIVLDHVAVAAEHRAETFPRYAGELGARWLSGGWSSGFATAQLGFAGGLRLEILAPHRVDRNDFLRRFLDRSGAGPHHLTFKVADLVAALAAAEAFGLRPLSVDMSDSVWKEAFLHPKDVTGIVIQLAESVEIDWATPPPEGFPVAATRRERATLIHVAHAVPDLADAQHLFGDLLGGTEVDRGTDRGSVWVDLAWPGPGRVRLIQPDSPESPLAEWIGDRPGRFHHLAFGRDNPASVTDATLRADGVWEVAPEKNLGVRLLVCPRTSAARFAATNQGNNEGMAEKMDKIKGRTKEAVGDLTDNDRLKREGKVDQATSTVKEKVGDVADKVKEHLPGKD